MAIDVLLLSCPFSTSTCILKHGFLFVDSFIPQVPFWFWFQKTLDYVKMDVEFSEWPALYDWLKTGLIKNIRQLAIEVHTPEMDVHFRPDHQCTYSNTETLAFMLKILLGLQNAGFDVYYFRTNYKTMFRSRLTERTWYCCHNLHFLNRNHPENAWRPGKS